MLGQPIAEHGRAKQAVGCLVGHQNAEGFVEYHNAGPHALHNLLVQGFQALDSNPLALGNPFGLLQSLGYLLNDQRYHEKGDAQQAGFCQQERGVRKGLHGKVKLLEHHYQCGQSSNQEAQAPAQQNVAGCHGNQKQYRQAALQAPIGMDNEGQHGQIGNQRGRLCPGWVGTFLGPKIQSGGCQRQTQIDKECGFKQ